MTGGNSEIFDNRVKAAVQPSAHLWPPSGGNHLTGLLAAARRKSSDRPAGRRQAEIGLLIRKRRGQVKNRSAAHCI